MLDKCFPRVRNLNKNKSFWGEFLLQIYIPLSFITNVLTCIFGITDARLYCLPINFKNIHIFKILTDVFYSSSPSPPLNKKKRITCLSVRYASSFSHSVTTVF